MSILTAYEQAIQKGDIEDNPEQRCVLQHLQRLASELGKSKSWLSRIRKTQLKGIYLYGPVGIGKTYLIDLFYQSLNYRYKARYHFHHFMQQVDAQLRRLQGEKNPLQKIAANFAKSTRLLCFDEFMVHDVAHAMILADLLKALMANGVVLVMTSNIAPDNLYLNGVQRARFLPVIDLIKKNCDVLHMENKKDYRLGREPQFEAWLYPLNSATEQKLARQFEALAENVKEQGTLKVQHRTIPYVKCSDKAVWFDFSVICNLPRSQLDYLEIASRFDAVFIAGVPRLGENDTVAVILLVQLIDVLYDRGIRLLVSAEVPVENLYLKGEMSKEFKRAQSRLQEMQSADYLHRHPRRGEQAF